MKTLKLILTAIMLIVVYVANAQTIQVYKDGAVVKEYSSAEVDSVVYKPAAAEPRFYYYAGWDCPNSVEELERMAVEPFGDFVDMTKVYTKSDPIRDLYLPESAIINPKDERLQYFVVIPNGHSIYDDDGDVTATQYDRVTSVSIPNYTIWQSAGRTKKIYGIYLY